MTDQWRARLSLLACTVVPIAGAALLHRLHGQYSNEGLHATVEAVGGCVALVTARLLMGQMRYEKSLGHFLWVASALVGMGTLDLFHASSRIDASFYWTRALATFVGGMTMATVWMPSRWARIRWLFLPQSLGVAAMLGGAACLHWANALPLMFGSDGYYVSSANVLNIIGGLGFLAAAGRFMQRWRARRVDDDLVFASYCFLVSAGALLFMFARMWGSVWWFIHLLRLAGYMVLARYLFSLFQAIRGQLARTNERLEERVRARTAALELEKDRRERYVAALAHDLRSPLNAALLGAQTLLRTDCDEERQRRASTRVVAGVERAAQMIEDLLDANRITAGHPLPLELERCELTSMLRGLVEDLPGSESSRVRLRYEREVAGHWSCRAVRRIFENLVANALKYGEPGTPVTLAVSADDGAVRVTVHNAGAAIPASEQATIFEDGVRGQASRRAGEKGWGIGLTIVRGYVEAHGGRVSLRSDGEGTVFTVELPLDARPFVRASPVERGAGA